MVAGVAVGAEPEAAPNEKLGVFDVPERAPPPKIFPGLLVGVLDAPPPPKMLVELVAVLAVLKRLGVVPPDELGTAPNVGLLGVLLLLLPRPKLKAMMAASEWD